MEKTLISNSPHIRGGQTTKGIMINVLIALAPAAIIGCVFFGFKALAVLLVSVVSSIFFEFIYKLIMKKNFKEILHEFDYTSAVTGLLLGLNLSSNVPLYLPILGSAIAIIAVKMLFGGTGKNFVNPALAGRIFLLISFSVPMATGWAVCSIAPVGGSYSIVAGQTVLSSFLSDGTIGLSNLDLFLGTGVAGCIGETSKLALLLGGIYLFAMKVIDWKPLIYIVVTGLVSVIYAGNFNAFLPSILSGGLFLGAIFMATDYVTSPNTKVGSYIYYILLGILTAVLRDSKGTEMVSYCIFLMNFAVPLIDRFVIPKPFGYEKPPKKVKEKKTKKKDAQPSGEVKGNG